MIKRELENVIVSRIKSGKAILLLGPRQTGKTTLLEKIVKDHGDYLLLDCDDIFVRQQLESINTEELRRIIGDHKTVFIDEAQRVKNIGLVLKIITDRIKGIKLFVSGSSSIDLLSEISEPLTGRKWEYFLYPVSWHELNSHYGHMKSLQQLETRIIFGMYPEVINNPGQEREILKQLTSSYLYKDLLSYHGIRKPDLIEKLLRALALQTGNEVSYNELSSLLQVDKKTVSNYIDLLEKAFIIFRLQPFSRNLRKEISSNRKIYFYDTGLCCSLLRIENQNQLNNHYLKGALFENLILAELLKRRYNKGQASNIYFWRDHRGMEIDLIIENADGLTPVEIKSARTWNSDFFLSLEKWNRLSGNLPENTHVVYGGDESVQTSSGMLHSWKSLDFIV